ncbi:MAG TPA: hypothetical protein VFQ61_03915 [Polyangiaceae bacterium]|nr:hypothetical protein [Polyangiaceae bacterium]
MPLLPRLRLRGKAVAIWALVLLALTGAPGCSKLSRFDTGDGKEPFCGKLVQTPPFSAGLMPDNVQPRTFELKLNLDMKALTSRGELASIVGSISSSDGAFGLCHTETSRALFEDAPLRTIPELDHDQLSLLEFGEGREYSFFAWADSTCQGTILTLVSLMRNDEVEIRLFKPAALPTPNARPQEQPGFGLFRLTRREFACSF